METKKQRPSRTYSVSLKDGGEIKTPRGSFKNVGVFCEWKGNGPYPYWSFDQNGLVVLKDAIENKDKYWFNVYDNTSNTFTRKNGKDVSLRNVDTADLGW